jgi:hypothetical protein
MVQNILHNNGLPLTLINALLVKQKPLKISFTEIQSNKKWATFTFFCKETYCIAKIFRRTPISTVFKTKKSIRYLFKTESKYENKFQKSGVYQLTCKNCGKIYTGQTARSFEKKSSKNIFTLSRTTVIIPNLRNTS